MDENPAVLQEARDDLEGLLRTYMSRHHISNTMVSNLMDLVEQHRSHCLAQGVDFPKLVPLILPSISKIRLHPADLPKKNVEIIVVNLKREFPDLPMTEIAEAVLRVYPDFRPQGPVSLKG